MSHPLAKLGEIAGASAEEIARLDEIAEITHHMNDGDKTPTCGAGPMDWWKANPNPQVVDCVPCLRRLL